MLPIGVNPAGDTGDVSPPPKLGLRGTVMHYVPPNLASNLVCKRRVLCECYLKYPPFKPLDHAVIQFLKQ